MPVTWDDVVREARALGDIEVTTSFGNAALKLDGKLLAWRRGHSGDDGVALFRCELFERELLLQARPKIFFLHEHYNDYPAVLAWMKSLSRRELRERLKASAAFLARERPAKRARKR